MEEFPHHPAFIFEDRQCSYLEFARLETAAIPVTSVNRESPPYSPWRAFEAMRLRRCDTHCGSTDADVRLFLFPGHRQRRGLRCW